MVSVLRVSSLTREVSCTSHEEITHVVTDILNTPDSDDTGVSYEAMYEKNGVYEILMNPGIYKQLGSYRFVV